jgi:hypothetical protein
MVSKAIEIDKTILANGKCIILATAPRQTNKVNNKKAIIAVLKLRRFFIFFIRKGKQIIRKKQIN